MATPRETVDPFALDPNDLDGEWLRMSQKTRHFGRLKADAEYAHNRARAALAVVSAQVEQQVRRAPAQFGLPDKPQVGDINATVTQHPAVQAAQERADASQYALAVAAADVFAAVDNRKALENLVELLRLDYLAEREPRPRDAAFRTRTDEAARRDARQSE